MEKMLLAWKWGTKARSSAKVLEMRQVAHCLVQPACSGCERSVVATCARAAGRVVKQRGESATHKELSDSWIPVREEHASAADATTQHAHVLNAG